TNTLDGLVSYINGHALGVTASVITDATGARLALVSNTTGLPGDLTITSNIPADPNLPSLSFTKSAKGTNASFTLDGVPVSSASNTVTGVLAGVTLNLTGEDPFTEVQLNVGPDVIGATQAINDFVNAYNTVMAAINSQFAINTATNTAGVLSNDA